MKPVMALVGRPNVGKSTLFNRLTQSRDAIVADFPGLTRDRHYGQGKQGAFEFIAVDTGGFEPDASVLAERMEIPEDKIRKIMKIAKEPISMETPIGDDDDSHLGDFIEDGANTAPIEAAMQAGLRDVVKEILDGLTPREAKVLRMRFGIEMDNDHTLEEVGKQFDVTRERIRQIEAKALRKLKHPSRSDKLRSFIDTL